MIPLSWLCAFFAGELVFVAVSARWVARGWLVIAALTALLNAGVTWLAGAFALMGYEDRFAGEPGSAWTLASMTTNEQIVYLAWRIIPGASLAWALIAVVAWVSRRRRRR